MQKLEVKQDLNHTAAHVLAAAVLKLYPETKIGFGPSIKEGFYYDFDFKEPISDKDLNKIEKEMKRIVSGGYKVEQVDSVDLSNQPYKEELLKEIKNKGHKDTYYGLINPSNKTSIFTDLCEGGHIDSTSKLKFFKLLSIAGAYWRGNSDNAQLTRIYGTAWETKEELEEYLNILKERKERDHRKIGKEMDIFMFDHLVGQGFPIWLENGMVIKNSIQKFIRDIEYKYGFREVQTPAFGSEEMYKISGHLAHYKDTMYDAIEADNERLIMRPMTCPHHIVIFNRKRRSYNELPIRMSEQARLYRYEKSGALTGLERVRSMELTEGHIFAREDQIFDEFKNAYKLIVETLNKFNIEIDYVSLSLRDPEDKDKYYPDDAMWESAENSLRKVLDDLKIDYKEMKGEAAFYGPKIDIQVRTALGHEITMSTLQLDFLLPKKFGAKYIDNKEQWKTPILIHRGLIGTYERFISILLEQTKGNLPFWCAPKQFAVIPVANSAHGEYAKKINDELVSKGFRSVLLDSDERVSKKIRESQVSKTKYQIVIGDDEVNTNTINVREYGSADSEKMELKDLIAKLNV